MKTPSQNRYKEKDAEMSTTKMRERGWQKAESENGLRDKKKPKQNTQKEQKKPSGQKGGVIK